MKNHSRRNEKSFIEQERITRGIADFNLNRMKKNNITKEEERVRILMRETKEKAPNNLKHRIMHQIETENVVAPRKLKRSKESGNVIRELGSIFGTMYAVLAGMIAAAYFIFGQEFLLSSEFIGASVFVAFVFSMLWLISQLDRRLRSRKFKE